MQELSESPSSFFPSFSSFPKWKLPRSSCRSQSPREFGRRSPLLSLPTSCPLLNQTKAETEKQGEKGKGGRETSKGKGTRTKGKARQKKEGRAVSPPSALASIPPLTFTSVCLGRREGGGKRDSQRSYRRKGRKADQGREGKGREGGHTEFCSDFSRDSSSLPPSPSFLAVAFLSLERGGN